MSLTKEERNLILDNDSDHQHCYCSHHPITNTIRSFFKTDLTDPNFRKKPIIISLSGGPDSIVLLYIARSLGLNLIAGHINYGNRDEAEIEETYVHNVCDELGVTFEVLKITEMKRGEIKRDVYEKFTAKMRFDFYKSLMKKYSAVAVLYGHHRGDIFENIVTNSMLWNRNFSDLVVIKPRTIKNGVPIWRPMLNNYKKDIYDYSHKYNIPYLKDTTPEWSNRGKIRNIIVPTLQDMGLVKENVVKKAYAEESLFEMIKTNILDDIVKYSIISNDRNGFAVSLRVIVRKNRVHREIISLYFTEMLHLMGSGKLSDKSTDNLMKILNSDLSLTKNIVLKKDLRCIIYDDYLIVYNLNWKPIIKRNLHSFIGSINGMAIWEGTSSFFGINHINSLATSSFLKNGLKFLFEVKPTIKTGFSSKTNIGLKIIPRKLSISIPKTKKVNTYWRYLVSMILVLIGIIMIFIARPFSSVMILSFIPLFHVRFYQYVYIKF